MDIAKFKEIIKDNTLFTVCFTKKDGTERVMNARLAVKKYIKGTNEEATAKRKETLAVTNQINCYEMRGTSDREGAENYRTINLNTVKWLKAHGKTFDNEGRLLA